MHSNKTKCFLKSFQMKETMRVVKKNEGKDEGKPGWQ